MILIRGVYMGKGIQILKISQKLNKFILKNVRIVAESLNIKRKKKLINLVALTKEQKKEIDDFFKEHYGKKIKYHWHRLYQSYTGVFRKDYFPEVLLTTKLELVLNSLDASMILGNKNLLKQLFSTVNEVHIPETYLCCIEGTCRDAYNNLSNLEMVSDIVKNLECVIKKSTDTSSGRDVMICSFEDGIDKKTNMSIGDIVGEMGDNFVIQERIKQFKELSDIYPNALNTFRVMTYILDGEIYHCPIALRLAQNGADRDNIHYGGMCIGVDDEGFLYDKAFEEYGASYEVHPDTLIKFKGYRISKAKELISCAKKLHACIPMLGIVSWDLTIDDEGRVTLIEANTMGQSAWFPQMIQGKALFGKNTPRLLEMIRNCKN